VALLIVVVAILAALNNDQDRGGQTGSSGAGSGSPTGGSDPGSTGSGSRLATSRATGPFEPVRDGQFEFAVARFSCGRRTVSSGSTVVHAQGQFCLVTLGVRNVGDEPRSLLADAQHLYDADGNRHQVANAATWASSPQLLTAPRLNPGIAVSGTLVYDVPAAFRPLRLELHDSPLSGGRSLRLG
jgi:hypothetical protein